jgi:hypothetical protein
MFDEVLTGIQLQGGGDPFISTSGNEEYALVGIGEDSDGEIYLIRVDEAAPSVTLNNGTIFRIDH